MKTEASEIVTYLERQKELQTQSYPCCGSVPKMAEALLQIHKLHMSRNLVNYNPAWCTTCNRPYPCPTVRIIESCLGDEP